MRIKTGILFLFIALILFIAEPVNATDCGTCGSNGQSQTYCDNGQIIVKTCGSPSSTCYSDCGLPNSCTFSAPQGPCGPGVNGGNIPTQIESVFGVVTPPSAIATAGYGATGINNFLSLFVKLIYLVAAIIFVFILLLGAFQWITSGGEKENIAKARSRITHAIIGLAILALAFVIIRIIGQILGLELFFGQNTP